MIGFNTNSGPNMFPNTNPNPTFNPNPSPNMFPTTNATTNPILFKPSTNMTGGFNIGGNQPNQGMNPMNPMNPNQPNMGGVLLPNQNIPSQQLQIYIILNQLRSRLRPQINTDLYILQLQQQQAKQEINDCITIAQTKQFQEEYLRQVKERCIILKNNNQIILQKMFNIKEKINRMASIYAQRNPQYEQEFAIVNDNIRRVKMQITNKLKYLKNKRLSEQTINKSTKVNKKSPPINIAMKELSDATQIINTQLIKQRQQIKVLIKQLYNQSI